MNSNRTSNNPNNFSPSRKNEEIIRNYLLDLELKHQKQLKKSAAATLAAAMTQSASKAVRLASKNIGQQQQPDSDDLNEVTEV